MSLYRLGINVGQAPKLVPPEGLLAPVNWWEKSPASKFKWRYFVKGTKGSVIGGSDTKDKAVLKMQNAYLDLDGYYMELRELGRYDWAQRDYEKAPRVKPPPTLAKEPLAVKKRPGWLLPAAIVLAGGGVVLLAKGK